MANVKISALTAYSTQHGDDLVPILDVHDTTMATSGTDKGCTIHNLFGAPTTGQFLVWSGSSTGSIAGHTMVGSDLPVFVASGSSHAVGAVPDPGASAGTTKYLREDATWVVPPGSGSGTVTSVTFTGDGTVLDSNASSAVTTSGTLTATLLTQSANKFLAGPTTPGTALPTFRSVVYSDLPIMVAAGDASHAPGMVPDPGAISSGGTKYLCDNATWSIPSGAVAGGSTSQIQYNSASAFAGSSLMVFDGSVTTFGSTLRATGAVDESALTLNRMDFGCQPPYDNPRIVFEHSTYQMWEIDVWEGTLRLYTPGDGNGILINRLSAGEYRIILNGYLNLSSHSAPSSPVSGDTWYDSTRKAMAFRENGLTSFVSTLIYSQVTAVSVSTSTDATLANTTGAIGTLSLPANYMIAGKSLRFRFGGYYTTSASPVDCEIYAMLGSYVVSGTGTLTTQGPFPSQSDAPWNGELLLSCTVGGGAGTSKIFSSGYIKWGSPTNAGGTFTFGPSTSIGAWTSGGVAASPDLTISLAIDLRFKQSGLSNLTTITQTHLMIESIG